MVERASSIGWVATFLPVERTSTSFRRSW